MGMGSSCGVVGVGYADSIRRNGADVNHHVPSLSLWLAYNSLRLSYGAGTAAVIASAVIIPPITAALPITTGTSHYAMHFDRHSVTTNATAKIGAAFMIVGSKV